MTENGLNEVLSEGNQSRDGRSLEPVDNGGSFPRAGVDDSVVIELAEENECWAAGCTVGLGASLVVDVEELVLLTDSWVLSSINEDLRELF